MNAGMTYLRVPRRPLTRPISRILRRDGAETDTLPGRAPPPHTTPHRLPVPHATGDQEYFTRQ